MKGRVPRFALCDSGFWIALLDSRDAHHQKALGIYSQLELWHALLPWPALYEVASTRLARDARKLERLNRELRSQGVHKLQDGPYRESALEKTLAPPPHQALSLVDSVMREMIVDVNVKMHAFVTFNTRDFRDVCHRRRIPMIIAPT